MKTEKKSHTRWKQGFLLARISGILHVISGHQGATINIQEAPRMSGRGGMFVHVSH